MFELMRDAKGVGLAAPQVGQNIRLFVMNPTGEPQDDRVYVNPVLTDAEGEEEAEEGCLSLPESTSNVVRGQADEDAGPGPRRQRRSRRSSGFVAAHLAARVRPPQRHAAHRPHGPRRARWRRGGR